MTRKKKKAEESSGPAGAPDWVVTFTDMISLLVTFFILLLTFSSMDANELMKVDSFLQGNKGIHKSSGASLPEFGKEDVVSASSFERGSSRPHTRPADELPESLEEMGQELTKDHREIDLNDLRNGIQIEFGAEESFEPGSSEVSDALGRSLGELARVLQHYPHMIVIEGFTDGAFRRTPAFKSAEQLSIARAKAAAAFMLEESELSPELIQIAGFGDGDPRADNASPGGRQLNRRVRIRVLSISKFRLAYLEAHEGGKEQR